MHTSCIQCRKVTIAVRIYNLKLQLISSSCSISLTVEQDLHDILSITNNVAARWEHIGDAFHLCPGTLETIRRDCLDSEACLREVILRWVRKSGYDHQQDGPPTWSWVVEAVGSPAGGNNPELARRIADQYLNGTF